MGMYFVFFFQNNKTCENSSCFTAIVTIINWEQIIQHIWLWQACMEGCHGSFHHYCHMDINKLCVTTMAVLSLTAADMPQAIFDWGISRDLKCKATPRQKGMETLIWQALKNFIWSNRSIIQTKKLYPSTRFRVPKILFSLGAHLSVRQSYEFRKCYKNLREVRYLRVLFCPWLPHYTLPPPPPKKRGK